MTVGNLISGVTVDVGGAIGGGATAYAVLRADASGNLIANSSLLFGGAAAGTGLYIVAGTATTDVQALSITQTWNAAGVTFSGAFKVNATNTASATGSKIADFQLGGTSVFAVTKAGATGDAGSPNFYVFQGTRGAIAIATGAMTSTAAAFSQTVAFNASGVTFTGWLLNVTNTASAAASLLADLQVSSASKFKVALDGSTTTTGFYIGSVTASITASTTQTQGQGALTTQINQVSVCANANDTVTLPAAVAGLPCTVINRGAQTLQIFPASGDAINAAAVNASTTLAAGAKVEFKAYDATNWESV